MHQNELVNKFPKQTVEKCSIEIKDSGIFSILADEAVDISNVEQISIIQLNHDFSNSDKIVRKIGGSKNRMIQKKRAHQWKNAIYSFCNFFSTKIVYYSEVKETGDGTLFLTWLWSDQFVKLRSALSYLHCSIIVLEKIKTLNQVHCLE